MKLDELAAKIDATVVGDGSIEINSVASLETAGKGQVGFLSNPKYASQLQTTGASAVIVSPKVNVDRVALLKTADPYYAFSRALVILHGHRKHPHAGVHPAAHVEKSATIGEGTVIYPGAYVGPDVSIGRDCIIYPNVTIYDQSQIGDRVIIHAGASIGNDGFGFATHAGVHHKIVQIGRVIIEDDVEIGPNTAIERGALLDTKIGTGTKIDGLVVVGHGSTIGPHCILVAQTGIAGSVTIGHHVTMGGQVGVAGHLSIGDNVTIAAKSGIMGDVEEKSFLIGMPAMPALQARRVYSTFTKLPELLDRIKELESRLDELGESDV